jgi:microcystin degradation protein MlrC
VTRVAIGGLWHETNTFATPLTSIKAFEVYDGGAILDAFRGTRTPIGGFLDGAGRLEAIPAFYASATPSGTVERRAYDQLLPRFLDCMTEAKPDAVFLDLHGAMVVEGCDEVEADIVRRLRERVGRIPIGCVLDFHANISDALVHEVDLLAGYKTYPHIDPHDRGLEIAVFLPLVLAGQIRPARSIARPPLLTAPQAQRTAMPPMSLLMLPEERARVETTDLAFRFKARAALSEILNVTVAGGFPYADVPHAGLSVVVTSTNGPSDEARQIASWIARKAWDSREQFRVTNVAPEAAVARALREPAGPVILVDQADNIGGGSPGDGTVLLAELLKAKAKGAVVTITDPEVAARAREGETFEGEVGGKTDRLHGPPVRVRARVVRVGSGDFNYKGSYMTNRRVQAGRTAVLDVDGVRIVVRERKVMPFDAEELRVVGLEPAECRIIVVKSALAWRAAYGDLARAVIDVDTPGSCTARLESLPYKRLRRPIYPLDPDTTWSPSDAT